MMSLEKTRECIAAAIQPLDPVRLPLADAAGRVLREPATAREDVPAFDRSAMDGYAIGAQDSSDRFRIVGEITPGKTANFPIGTAECARIFTGAQIPFGASQVLKQEDVRVEEGWMIPVSRNAETYIRHRGEDARAGDLLLTPGQRLGPGEIALLAALGLVQPQVSPLCRTVHFATGDELVDPASSPAATQIRDSNSPLVRAFVEGHGGVISHQERVPDDPALLTEKARLAADTGCDLLLFSGGASVGAYDFGRAVLERLGFQIHFEKLNLRPGKPLAFATRGRQAAFVLPGNPLSHLTVLHCVVRVAFERMAGIEPHLRILNARLRTRIHIRSDGRDTLCPARVDFVNGEPVADPLRWRSSGDITGLAGLNAFIRCPVPALDSGASVPCILLYG